MLKNTSPIKRCIIFALLCNSFEVCIMAKHVEIFLSRGANFLSLDIKKINTKKTIIDLNKKGRHFINFN